MFMFGIMAFSVQTVFLCQFHEGHNKRSIRIQNMTDWNHSYVLLSMNVVLAHVIYVGSENILWVLDAFMRFFPVRESEHDISWILNLLFSSLQ